jgi:hypothetical protein
MPSLQLLERSGDQAILQNADTGEEYVAPASALTKFDEEEFIERHSRARETESIVWTSLPEWVQFAFEIDDRGEVHRRSGAQGREVWDASVTLHLDDGDHRGVFAACLNSLDACGFDATGIERPDHSYRVSILQWGYSLNAHVRSYAGESGSLTVLNTLGHLSAFLRYSPS